MLTAYFTHGSIDRLPCNFPSYHEKESVKQRGEHPNLLQMAPSGGLDNADVSLIDFHGILR